MSRLSIPSMSDRMGHGHGPFQTPFITASFSINKLWICALLVIFVFPHTSYELFEFGGAAKSGSVGVTGDAMKPIGKRPFEKKFKFHKIERVYFNDEEGQDDEASAGVDADKNDDVVDENKKRNEDDGDDTSQPMDASEQTTESEELTFKRARTAHKERRSVTSSSTKSNGEKRSSSEKRRDSTHGDKSEESQSFFGSLFGSLFGGGASSNEKLTSEEDKSAEKKEPSNSVIDWLKWFSERNENVGVQEIVENEEADAETWFSYLNRWPFNTLFNIGKPEKPIRMPRGGRERKQKAASAEDGDADEATPVMSQENFETVLHTLPSFVVNPTEVDNTECRQQLQIFGRQLRGNKLWTLQMLDATGKITSGVLRGNINQFGDFDQCMQVKTVVKVTPEIPVRIRGKYCLAHIEIQTTSKELKVPLHYAQGRGLWGSHFGNPSHFVPRYSIANWGVCIPHLCNGEVVQKMLESNLRAYNTSGLEFHVEVDDDDCYTRSNVKFLKLIKKDPKFTTTISCICGLITLCMGSLLYKYCRNIKDWIVKKMQISKSESNGETERSENETEAGTKTEETEDVRNSEIGKEEELPVSLLQSLMNLLFDILNAFSPQRTLIELLGSDHFETQFPIFNVLKLGASFALYVCFKYIMIGHLPIINRDKLVRALDQPQSVLFRSPLIYMDVLLMISGFLVAYQLAEEIEQKTHIQLLKRMALKISRYLPTLYVALLFQTYVLPRLGAGPLWTNLVGQNTRLCEQQMWRNLFSVQNAIDFEDTCSPMTIQLALEVQLYILGPLIVWLYHTDADAAFFIYGALHVMSVAARYSRTQNEYLSVTLFHGMNISKFYRTANMLYSSPISRGTAYLLGLGTGLLHRSQSGVLEIASELKPVGWLCAILSLVWCFWAPAVGMRSDFVYTAGDAASYAAWCPLILGLGLAWCIFMFPRDENSVLRFITTMRPVLFLSRITFPIQLMTYVVVLYNTASVTEPRKYHLTDLVNFNEIAVIIGSGVAVAFLIDVPAQHLRKIVINRLFIERQEREHDHETEPSSGAEASEPEAEVEDECETDGKVTAISEDVLEQSKDDTEGIWGTEDATEDLVVTNNSNEETSVAEEDEEFDDKETEISEEDEVKKRPLKDDNVEKDTTSFTRRQRRISDD
ncbi:PREDICTED: uncharacterized protein LOC108971409 [Bactrocera latifrons]|uniref:uncharacterized protein LOC108971409 n=1 Tax=Bactrocera latifrons TaxID=174628 RepID=UPI0008DCB02A|nr:PREDICTED: uncharacterized protein LOC108971409 [Bactrocera latifrons]